MDSRLLLITQSGSVDALYSLIQKNPCILQNADVLPIMHTPLHEASSMGMIDMAMELMVLKPSFAKKLNSDGFSPLHLAIENRQTELALELVKFDPSLVRIHGRGDLLTEFLLLCPDSIRDVNVNGETALHITVINDRYEELKVLRGWLQLMRNNHASSTENHVLNKRDRQGNTALHLAAYKNNHQSVKQLLKCMSLNRNILNKSGMTALDVLRANGQSIETEKIVQKAGGKIAASLSQVEKKSVFLRKQVTFKEYCSTRMARFRSGVSDGTRNALLVITALIITATYQTAAQPQEKKELHDLTISDLKQIILEIVLLWGFNTAAFFLAIALTFILLPVGRVYTWWFIAIAGPLMCSYTLSVYMKYSCPVIFKFAYLMVFSGFVIYLLVFYMRWKRTTQKKVPNPKTELLSGGLNTKV
ncbi:unnamed protein product [Arabis nemorensis]|uniref:Uncharacterized protein n=1 Tax=Arabis nemorensis TaxID=586526 RepID=A0A565CQF5_9BRAS|nr:unnamed protein product [Arabis nemorensis]